MIAFFGNSSIQLKFSETINTKQELKYIKSLFDFPVDKNNIVKFAAQMKKFEFARKIKKLTNKQHVYINLESKTKES